MAQYTSSIKETALLLGQYKSLVGVLTEPQSDTAPAEGKSKTGVLLMNAGLIHHIGPNRIYVKLARRLADMGYCVLRYDFSGIGDSGPRTDKMPAIESVVEEAQQVMDYLENLKDVKKFVLIGLCAGAATAFRMATIDPRVKNIILINPLLPNTQQVERMRQASHYRHRALLDPHSWVKFFLMKVNYRSMFQVISYGIKKRLFPRTVRNDEPKEVISSISQGFKLLRTQNMKILLINSSDDVGWAYFKDILGPEYMALIKSGILKTEVLIGSDHTVTPLRCQHVLLDIISNWISENC